jgi:hypothetical protein
VIVFSIAFDRGQEYEANVRGEAGAGGYPLTCKVAFSKNLESFKAAAALHFAYSNFVNWNSLRATPAMVAGIERDFSSVLIW